MPITARWASRRHWCGSSGASVATIPMIDPAPGRGSGPGAAEGPPGNATRSGPISCPAGTPLTVNPARDPWLAWTSTPTVCRP